MKKRDLIKKLEGMDDDAIVVVEWWDNCTEWTMVSPLNIVEETTLGESTDTFDTWAFKLPESTKVVKLFYKD